MYDELKRKAEDMGIQVTDLVKFFIKNGLEGAQQSVSRKENTDNLEESIAFLEAKVAQLDSLLMDLVKKFKIIEEAEDDEEVEIKDS